MQQFASSSAYADRAVEPHKLLQTLFGDLTSTCPDVFGFEALIHIEFQLPVLGAARGSGLCR